MSKRTVLITGGSSGIGKETAKSLLGEGYTVYTAARRIEKMDDLKKLGGIPLKMDVTKDDDMIAAAEQITQKHGGVDILINNAGFGKFGAVEDTPLDIARSQYDVNVFGLMRLTQLVLPGMRDRKFGKIVNISSMGGKMVSPFGGWYQSTKYAVEALSDALRMEVQQFGIDVILIEPGLIESDWEGIAGEGLLEISGKGVYGKSAKKSAKAMKDGYKNASSPSVIAETIRKAIRAKKPKTRYAAGNSAKPAIFMKWLLPDRIFDRLAMQGRM